VGGGASKKKIIAERGEVRRGFRKEIGLVANATTFCEAGRGVGEDGLPLLRGREGGGRGRAIGTKSVFFLKRKNML